MIKDFITMDLPIEDIYYDYKLVADSIIDDESYQKADAGILLSNLYDVVKILEKQIPKKVVHTHHCPSCDKALPIKGIADDYCSECFNWNYCPNCGQKIDWE